MDVSIILCSMHNACVFRTIAKEMVMKYRLPACALLLLLPLGGHATDYRLSFKDLGIGPDERVAELHVVLRDGRFSALKNVPGSWLIDLDNEAVASFEGRAVVGAAALDAKDLDRLFVVTGDAGEPIQVKGDVRVTKDFQQYREIALTPQNTSLSKLDGVKP
jgi:hypothetical protein